MRFALPQDAKFYHAVAVLVGTMVGVGIFGIPFAFAKAGFWVGVAWLFGLAVVVAIFNLIFAELALSTPGRHQVIGYMHTWLGPWGRRLATLANVISLYGALLAYIIVFGEFSHNVLSHFIAVDPRLYSILFAVSVSMLWVLRVKTIAAIEQAMVVLYTVVVLLIVVMGAGSIRSGNFAGWTADFWYLPYGVLLFALAGLSAIPIQRQLLIGRERLMRSAILSAMGFTAGLYLLFAFVVVGVSGDATAPAAIAGLYGFLGTPVVIIGSLLGMLTITTSYLMLGTALFETFHIDYHVRVPIAWLLTGAPPLFLFMSGMTNFIDIIGLIGAVAVGLLSVLILAAYLRARRARLREPEFRVRISTTVVLCMAVLFAAGIVFELVRR